MKDICLNLDAITRTLQTRIPNLLALYAFGSRIQGSAGAESDLDLAVLVAGYAEPLLLWVAGYAEPLLLWELSGDLADLAGTYSIFGRLQPSCSIRSSRTASGYGRRTNRQGFLRRLS